MWSILSVSEDGILNQSRCLLLSTCGATVEAAPGRDAEARLRTGDYDLMLVCYTVPQQEQRRLMSACRTHATNTRILLLDDGLTDPPPPGENVQRMGYASGPAKLLQHVQMLLGGAPRKPVASVAPAGIAEHGAA